MAHVKKVSISGKSWDALSPDLLMLGLFEDGRLSTFQKDVDEKSSGAVSGRISSGDFSAKLGKTSILYPRGPAERILLVGMGKREDFSLDRLRQTGGTAVKAAQVAKLDHIVAEVPGMDDASFSKADMSQAFTEGLILGSYKFLDYKSDRGEETVVDSITFVNEASREGMDRGQFMAQAVSFARNLAAHPSNVVTPSRMASEARRLSREFGIESKVMGREQFAKIGMGAFAAVSKGADEPPKFIIMEYKGGKKGDAPIAFVGKGITFDTGGISLKTSRKMDEMKYDMCGAAVVLGIMRAAGLSKPKVNLVGVIAATENMPGGHATKPGDIVKAYNGKSIEILNTDAEGRLVLADALAYTEEQFKPRYMVNFATLTGAVITALGHLASGVMGNDDELLSAIKKAGEMTGERVWELPLWKEYSEDIKSKVADVKNTGAPRQAGTIVGGAFLKEFVDETPWAHIDIAGTAWWDKDRSYIPAGPSGVGVRLSIELLKILG